MLYTLLDTSLTTATTPDKYHNKEADEHLQLTHEEFQMLEKQGYSTQEIVKAAHISMYTDKSIENILLFYKKSGSWHKTAKHFGVDWNKLETDQMRKTKQLNKANKEKIIAILAIYTNRTSAEISYYLKKEADLHFLIFAAAIPSACLTLLSIRSFSAKAAKTVRITF